MRTAPYASVHTAKKTYPCYYKNGCTIQPGEVYAVETITPWTYIFDDVDDEGRPVASPAGEWLHLRYHEGCRYRHEEEFML